MRNLALGILLQAFRDIVSPKKTSNKDWKSWKQDALDWFYSNTTHPGSLLWVCEVLEMNQKDLPPRLPILVGRFLWHSSLTESPFPARFKNVRPRSPADSPLRSIFPAL